MIPLVAVIGAAFGTVGERPRKRLAAFFLRNPPLWATVLGLSSAFIAVPHAYLTQAAMATGVNNLLVAHEYGLDRGLAAAAIAWTTAIVTCAGLVLVLL